MGWTMVVIYVFHAGGLKVTKQYTDAEGRKGIRIDFYLQGVRSKLLLKGTVFSTPQQERSFKNRRC